MSQAGADTTLKGIYVLLVEVESLREAENFVTGERAFVNVFCVAGDEEDAAKRTEESLGGIGFHLIKVLESRCWYSMLEQGRVNRRWRRLAEAVLQDGMCRFSTFFSWEHQG